MDLILHLFCCFKVNVCYTIYIFSDTSLVANLVVCSWSSSIVLEVADISTNIQ